MKMFDAYCAVGDVSPRKWLKDAYLRMDEALDNHLKAGFTEDDLSELLGYAYKYPNDLTTAILTMLAHNNESCADAMGWISKEEKSSKEPIEIGLSL